MTTPDVDLSDRELQVLTGMAAGQSNGELGRWLHLSEDTVKTHARRLFRKLNARDRARNTGRAVVVPTPPIDPLIPKAARSSPGTRGTVTLSLDERDVALLAGAVYPRERTAPWAVGRCRDALHRLIGT